MTDQMGDRAPQADEALSERLHRFAHGIRNRLAGMQQAMQHLAGDTPPLERAELATFGEQQFFKALREVEDLLDDLNVDRSATIGEVTTVPMAALTHTSIAGLEHRFSGKGQQVRTDMDDTVVVRSTTDHLDRIISALLSNASKFSPKGSTIRVRLAREGDEAVLTVRDQGVGLSPTDLDQVFVRYAWLANQPTDGEAQGRSTLARIHSLVQAHGGMLTAASTGPGQGSTFTLRLPVA